MLNPWIPGGIGDSSGGMGSSIAPQHDTAPASREPLPPCTAVGLERVEQLTAAALGLLRPGPSKRRPIFDDQGSSDIHDG